MTFGAVAVNPGERNMPDQNTDQPTLFETSELADRPEMPSAAPEMPARSSGPQPTGSSAGEHRRREAGPSQALSPFANLPLQEVCAFCGAEVLVPGYVIQDYEELGVFCKEECGDKRFRLYLNDTADEESGLDDVDQGPT
jgi:hypothetical protein